MEQPKELTQQEKADLALDARVAMFNGMFELPGETKAAMSRIREIVAEAGQKIRDIIANPAVKYDTGRLIATFDLLQHVKNTACDSITLPHYKK
jgi:hypothetical protein